MQVYQDSDMIKLHIIVGLIALSCAIVQGTTNGQGLLYPFDISDTLICYEEVKLLDGRTRIEPEQPPRLPYGMRVAQGNISRVYLPPDTT